MKRNFLTVVALSVAATCFSSETVVSPDGEISVSVDISDGHPVYSVSYKGLPIITSGRLGLKSKEAELGVDVDMTAAPQTTCDEMWSPVWGEFETVRNNYSERIFTFIERDNAELRFSVRFRVFNDGVGFRYEFPATKAINYMAVTQELTSFPLSGDPTIYCVPGDYDTDEYLYTTTALSEVGKNLKAPQHNESTRIPQLSVQTPLLLKDEARGIYYNIHEAALKGYSALSLAVDVDTKTLSAVLTPGADGVMAYVQTPFETPWRTLIISDDARDILASQLIYNLNEPSKIADTSWIKPQKFMGVWWEMFTGGKTWAYSDAYNAKPGITDYAQLKSNNRHPANNVNVRKYIDFAAANGIPGVLVEGWNEGWEDWGSYRKNRQFLFDKSYPDFDVDSLQQYALSKGVRLIMHHETAANAADYERQLERAFDFMNDHQYTAVKTGYVGYIIPRGEHHSSQWMVDHYIHVAERAAEHKIMIDSHEAVRPTGMMRTWPNWVAQESARGGEYESMGGNPPEHTTILPFTRLKGGPMDYTPGLFQGDLSYYNAGNNCKAGTTLARQLALYLTMPSPFQMACDLPDNYERFYDAFQFIKDVPVEWRDSKYLEAEPGEYITVARLDKHSRNWYAGAITDEKSREANIDCSFLEPGVKYIATIYSDGKDASFDKNPQSYKIYTRKVSSKSKLQIRLAAGGGCAVRFEPIK